MNLPQEIRTKNFETQITGLDDLLRGGLVLPTQNNEDQHANGLVILLKGKPGTGKTTLALQLLYHLTQVLKNKINKHVKEDGSNPDFNKEFNRSQYFSIEQSQNELEEKLMNLVICRIFNDIQSFVVSDKSTFPKNDEFKLDEDVKKELFEVYSRLSTLICFFDTLNKTFVQRKKDEEITKYIITQFDNLKFFFENFQYDRSGKKIVPTKCSEVDDKTINPYSDFENEYERVQFTATLNNDSIGKGLIDEFKKRLEKQHLTSSDNQLDSTGLIDLINQISDRYVINTDTTKKLTQKFDFKELDLLVNQFDQEITSLIQNHYDSHLPDDFSIEIKTAESVHNKADSPFNFMSAQKVHDFINEIDNGTMDNQKFYPCIVIDGLNILSEKEKKLINIGKLVKALKSNSFFSIIVYDGETDGSLYQDYYADLVIDLKGDVEKNLADYFLHQMQIAKSRFQQAALGWHQYKIKELGIQIFRSVHFHVHINNYQSDQLLESFTPAIDSDKFKEYFTPTKEKSIRRFPTNIEQILIDPAPGSFTAIFGARATFKTTLTLNFLYNVNQKEDTKQGDSLLISLIDNYETLKESSYCPMAKFHKENSNQLIDCDKCHKHLYVMHQRSGCVNSHEFFHNLDKRVSDHRKKTSREITRLAFWDLAQLEYRFPLLAADPMFLPGLVEYTKKKKIALIVMGAGNSKLTPAASAIADNVIFCWRSHISKKPENINELNKIIGLPALIPEQEVLCLYVDRCQGQLGNEGKELSFIPIVSDKGIEIKCPKIIKGDHENYVSTGFNRLDNYSLIKDAKRTINTIIDMQGMGSVNR